MIEDRSYDVPTQELIDITRDQIATLLQRNPDKTYHRYEVFQQPIPHHVDFPIGNTRELHNLKAHGRFQLWLRMRGLAGADEANRAFGRQGVIYEKEAA